MKHLPASLIEIAQILADHGWECHLVGGAIRDSLLGRPLSGDYDCATNAHWQDVTKIFRRCIPTGIKHGTVTILFKELKVEMTSYRADGEYSNSRHPDSVTYGVSLQDDLSRRDFTINALAWNILGKQLIDPFEGTRDIKSGIIKAVGVPTARFSEDSLRMLRAVRFASQLGFAIENSTLAAISDNAPGIANISKERIQHELQLILLSQIPSVGFKLLESTGLLAIIIPELADCRGIMQRGMHKFDVLDHLFYTMDASEPDLVVRLAALLHDIGKPHTRTQISETEASFHGHEGVSAQIAESLLTRLRFPSDVIADVTHLIKHHMFLYDDSWSDAAVRRFIARVGYANLPRLLSLSNADASGKAGVRSNFSYLLPLENRIKDIKSNSHALRIADLAINGNDLKSIGIPTGPHMGAILEELLEAVLDDPGLNTRELLLNIALAIKLKHLG